MKNKIFALVGPTGSGKSTLILEVLKKLGDRVGILKSVTTRVKRGSDDDLFSSFTSAARFIAMKKTGQELVQSVAPYGGNYYGTLQSDVDAILPHKHGICALVEEGVLNLMNAGYEVVVVKVMSDRAIPKAPDRGDDDAKRKKIIIPTHFTLHNSFEPGGKEKAVAELIEFIERSIT